MTNDRINFEMAAEEESPMTIKKECTLFSRFQRICTLDNVPNRKDHRPTFIITMSILHVVIHLLIYTDDILHGHSFRSILLRLGQLYLPCMRPTERNIRMRHVRCQPMMKHGICSYDELLKHECFSFAYPHQIWRMITVSLFHMDWFHLVSNLSGQLVQGIPLERKYGTGYILVIYWLSGLGASLAGMIRLGSRRKHYS